MTAPRLRAMIWTTLLVVTSCHADDPADATPVPSGVQATLRLGMAPPWKSVVVVVLDDADTPLAIQLRSAIADGIGALARSYLDAPEDPGVLNPVDVSFVLVRPSAPPGSRFLSPSLDSRLAWAVDRARVGNVAHLRAGLAGVFESGLPVSGGRYDLLNATTRAVELVTGAGSAESPDEADLLRDAAGRDLAGVLVASTRDDDGGGDPSATAAAVRDVYQLRVVLPDEAARAFLPDAGTPGAAPRLAAWADAARADVDVKWCPTSEHPLICPFRNLWGENYVPAGVCELWPIAKNGDGGAACRVTVTRLGTDAHCPGSSGAMGGDGMPTAAPTTFHGEPARVCELPQLDAVAGVACRNDPNCANCGTGWCAPDIVFRHRPCPPGLVWSPLRFTGASVPRPGAIELTCALDKEAVGVR